MGRPGLRSAAFPDDNGVVTSGLAVSLGTGARPSTAAGANVAHHGRSIRLVLSIGLWIALLVTAAGRATSLAGLSRLTDDRLAAVGLVGSGLIAVAASIVRSRHETAYRRSYLLLGLASAAETCWLIKALYPIAGKTPLAAQAGGDIGHLVAVPLAVFALLTLPAARNDRGTWLRTALDGLAAAFALGALAYNVGLPAGTGQLGAVHPVVDIVLGTTVVAMLARARFEGDIGLSTLLSIVLGVALSAISDTLAASHVSTANWSAADPYLAIGACGQILVAYGMLRPIGQRDSVAVLRWRERIAVMAPIVPMVPAGVIVVVSIVQGTKLSPTTVILLGLLVLTVLVTTVLTRLDQLVLSRTLEHRVVERTLALRTHAKWFRSLVQNSSDVITIVDPSGVIGYQTPSAARVLGYDPAAMVGRRFGGLLHVEDAERLEAVLVDAALRPRSSQLIEFAIMHSDGHWCETETVVTSLVDDNDIRGLVLNTRDVSERRELERQLTEQAFSDSLTGLANRALFRNRVEHAVAERQGTKAHVAVLFCDLDGFKAVNDSQGHAVGDSVLGVVAERLRRCVRPGDTVARLGGDEFAILVVGPDAETDATMIAARLRDVLTQPFVLDGREVMLGASTGIAVTDRGTETAEQIMRNADLAMYRAKAARDGGYIRFESEMHDALLLRVQAESDLRQALARGELVLHYQPTVNLHSGQVVGVEALIRWYHPTRGIVQPMDFIGLAEETGLVESIGEWAIRESCREGARWQEYAPSGGIFSVAVNVSSRQLTPGLPAIVRSALAATGMPPGALILEMTESVLIERADEAIAVLRELKSLGVRIAIDDFGTGYSSLSYLTRFPVDILKIDKSFVEQLTTMSGPGGHNGRIGGIGGEAGAAELIRTIVHLGRSLRLSTVAEGIETREQYAALLEMSCDLGQGFLFSRPLPAGGIDELFANLLVSSLPTQKVVYEGARASA
jgi:diguanylate cyclase (GGDEF)-like protein/PAS domain S-box-containing protein